MIENERSSENDRTSAVRFTAEGSGNRKIAGAIKALFKDAVKALTGRDDDEPQPDTRRHKSGETEKGFGMAANAITRVADTTPPDAYAAATGTLFATLDWLNPFHNKADNFPDMDNSFGNSHASFPSLDL